MDELNSKPAKETERRGGGGGGGSKGLLEKDTSLYLCMSPAVCRSMIQCGAFVVAG